MHTTFISPSQKKQQNFLEKPINSHNQQIHPQSNPTHQTIHENTQQDQESPQKNPKTQKRSNSVNVMAQLITNRTNKITRKPTVYVLGKIQETQTSKLIQQTNGFAEMYKNNLRRTVYQETKLMIREKKKKVQYRIQSIDPPGTYRGGSSMQMFSIPKKINKTICYDANHKDQPTNLDSMYKTIVQVPSHHQQKQTVNNELGISKFPIIKRKKKIASMENMHNFLQTLDKKTDKNQSKMGRRGKKGNLMELGGQRSPSRQDINPWETFADQFD